MRKTRLKVKKMEITELQREEENAWDAYVYNSNSSTFYHQLRSVLIKLFSFFVSIQVFKVFLF